MLDSPLGAFFFSFLAERSLLSLSLSFCPIEFQFEIKRSFSFACGSLLLLFFFKLVNSIRNLHKYIYAFHLCIRTEKHVMHIASNRWLVGWLVGRCAEPHWLAWENNFGLVEQRFHRKFPVNLFGFIYIFAAISLHKLLLNIPKLRNLFCFEWVCARAREFMCVFTSPRVHFAHSQLEHRRRRISATMNLTYTSIKIKIR